MKKYFIYQLKKNLLPLALLFGFALIVYVLPLTVDDYSYWNKSIEPVYITVYTGNITIALGLMSAIVPIYMFNYKMKKRSVDMYYSLPLSKTKILAVHFILGFAMVLAAYSAAYWLGFLIVVAKIRKLQYIFYFWLYLASIIPAFIIYALAAFSFTRASTLVDGIIFVITTHCVLFVMLSGVQTIIETVNYRYYNYVNPGAFIVAAPLSRVHEVLGYMITNKGSLGGYSGWSLSMSWGTSDIKIYDIVNEVVSLSVLTLGAAGATAAMFLTEKNCKAENCGQVSESIFGYKVMMPVYTVALFIVASFSTIELNAVIWGILAFCTLIATIIWRRTIKIGKTGLIYFAASVAAGLLCGLILTAL